MINLLGGGGLGSQGSPSSPLGASLSSPLSLVTLSLTVPS